MSLRPSPNRAENDRKAFGALLSFPAGPTLKYFHPTRRLTMKMRRVEPFTKHVLIVIAQNAGTIPQHSFPAAQTIYPISPCEGGLFSGIWSSSGSHRRMKLSRTLTRENTGEVGQWREKRGRGQIRTRRHDDGGCGVCKMVERSQVVLDWQACGV